MDLTNLETSDQLIAAGQRLSPAELMEFLKIGIAQPAQRVKLYPLLVGLPTHTFYAFMAQTSGPELDVLKEEASLEPLQHQLTKVVTELEQESNQIDQRLEELERYVESSDLSQMGQQDLFRLTAQVAKLIEDCNSIDRVAANTLILLWNTSRTDLIAEISRIKEHVERIERTAIKPLPQRIQERLYRVYAGLDSKAPATEGLAELSLILLHDYHALGLLMQGFTTVMDKPANSEKERIARRALLMNSVQKQLQKVGLETVEDLKKAGIFSVKSLQEYLAETPVKPT